MKLNTKKTESSCLQHREISQFRSNFIAPTIVSPSSNTSKQTLKARLNNGRWRPEEHLRFVEAILTYGNDWKKVQTFVGTRSCSQVRSHSQKFFLKMKKCNVPELANLCMGDSVNRLKMYMLKVSLTEREKLMEVLNLFTQENDTAWRISASENENEVMKKETSLLFKKTV